MRLKVTQDCIDRAEPATAWACPIAVALIRAGFNDPFVDPDLEAASAWKGGERFSFTLSRRALRFIERVDNGKRVRPTCFVLR
jgi:hypothetical protein